MVSLIFDKQQYEASNFPSLGPPLFASWSVSLLQETVPACAITLLILPIISVKDAAVLFKLLTRYVYCHGWVKQNYFWCLPRHSKERPHQDTACDFPSLYHILGKGWLLIYTALSIYPQECQSNLMFPKILLCWSISFLRAFILKWSFKYSSACAWYLHSLYACELRKKS